MLLLLSVILLTVFLLVTTRCSIVYKYEQKYGERRLSYRSLFVTTLIITCVWYGVYMFFSTDKSDFDDIFD